MVRHKKKKRAAVASVQKKDWVIGDLVVAKLRGHRPWPAQIQKPEDYGYETRSHRIFVTFFGTEETCFCSFNKITPFTTAVRKNLAEQLQKINTNPELERAIKEIFAADDEIKTAAKAHGSNPKEDDEMVCEKSEEEEPPIEPPRSRKRASAEAATVPSIRTADERPAKQEKTVKTMAAEQVQKLPRKVRIKVSTQGSDLGVDKVDTSTSQARQSENVDSAETPIKNGDRTTTTTKVSDSTGDVFGLPSKEGGDSIIVEVEEIVRHDPCENGGNATKETRQDSSAVGTVKTDSDGVEQMDVDDDKSVALEMTSGPPLGKEDTEKPCEPAIQMEDAEKTSEPAIQKEDAEKPFEPAIQMEDAEKTSEPAIQKEDAEKPCESAVQKEDAEKPCEPAIQKEVAEKPCEPAIQKEDAEKPCEPAIQKEDAEKPSELAIQKEDDSSTVKELVKSAVIEDGVEKMEVDEKLSSSSIDKEPTKLEPTMESVVTSEIAQKMEGDTQKVKIATEPAEDELGKADGPASQEVIAIVVKPKEQQEIQSTEAKVQTDLPAVADMDTSFADQEEAVPPVAKEGEADIAKTETRSLELEKANDGLQEKVPSASTKEDGEDKLPSANPEVVVLASNKDEETKERKGGEPDAPQVPAMPANDDAVPQTNSMDCPTPSKSTNPVEPVPGIEAVTARSHPQVEVLDQTEEDRIVKKTEDVNGTVKEVVDEDKEVKTTENPAGEVKKVEDADGSVKKAEA